MNTKAPTWHDSSIAGEWFWLAGASTGIGYAVAEVLAMYGAKLILMARNETNLKLAAKNLLRKGASDVRQFCADITDPQCAASARAFLGNDKIKGILLNAGGPHGRKPSELTFEDYENAHALLLRGPVMLMQALLPCVKEKTGSIVAITSTTVKEVNPSLPLSACYRSALVALLKNFAEELGPRGIRVNNVAPGYTSTERLSELAHYVAETSYGDKSEQALTKVYAEWGNKAPLRRVAEPTEIGETCAFLFSDRSSFITGHTLLADGGISRVY